MQYKGEALIPGDIGYFFVALSFTASLLSLIAYIVYTQKGTDQLSWRNLGRTGFFVHGISVLGIIGMLFYLIYNHYFEYNYVYSHASRDLPVKYMISCFWEGQEGSFLLWTFWHVILGTVLIFSARKWEGPVMSVVLLAQVTLSSMLLGLPFFEAKIGSNPFILLRNAQPDAPIFQFENYVSMIKDGQGLNPLLQNYWMVIHPPVLFLGFAATIVPFAYAIAGLWQRAYKEWIKPALPWTLFAGMTLGAGVLMGGAWAYEALNFGGFWAWDPVENAALVPWLLLIAGLHGMVLFKNRGQALPSALIFILLSFILVLYATFLTRSGVLGDSSVHSFTGLGLSGQLLIFLFLFLGVAVVLMVMRWKELPRKEEEDRLDSREFWMYIGALVFTLSAFHVIFVTSFPVLNKLPYVNMAPPANLIEHYNKVQLPIAVIVLVLTGFGQFLKYKQTPANQIWKPVGITAAVTAVFSGLLIWLTGMSNLIFSILLVASVYGVVGNVGFMLPQLKRGKFRFTASSVSHIGFSLLILGALISTSQQEVISINRQGIDYGENFDEKQKQENILLRKYKPKVMGNYVVNYKGDSTGILNQLYEVEYNRLDSESLDTLETFTLYPKAQVNKNMGLVASPDTRHYLTHDIYTHVTSIPDNESEEYQLKYDTSATFKVQQGDQIQFAGFDIQVRNLNPQPDTSKIPVKNYKIASTLKLVVKNKYDRKVAEPLFAIQNDRVLSPETELEDFGLKVQFTRIFPEEDAFEIVLSKGERGFRDYIIMKAIVFPYINFLWLGSIVMIIGMGMAIYRRNKGD